MAAIVLAMLISIYPWPIRQFDSPHNVSATLGDARGDSTDSRFHNGIDIPANIGTDTYSIISDTAIVVFNGVNSYVRVGNYCYVHINPSVDNGDSILGILDTINTPPDIIGDVLDYPNGNHLHLITDSAGGPYENPLLHNGGPWGYDDAADPICSIDFWRQGSEGQSPQQLQSPLDGRVDIRAHCQDVQTSGGTNSTSGIYRLEWLVRNDDTGDSVGPVQTTVFPQVQPPNNGDPVLLVYDRHHYSDSSPFYYWATNPIIDHQVEDHYWNTKQKMNEPDSVDADSIENAKFPDGNYWVKVTAYDIVDSAGSESVLVEIGNFNPKVRETEPDDGETGVSIHQTVYVRFSEAMDSTIDVRSAITISPGVNGDWEWLDLKSILFTPDPAFLKNTTYTVSLSSQLKDLQEQALAPYSFSFTTDTTTGNEAYPTKRQWETVTSWDVSVSWFNYYSAFQILYFEFPFYWGNYSILYFNRRGSIWFYTNHDLAHFDLPTSGGTGEPVIAVYNDSLRHLLGGYSSGRSRELSNPSREVVRWTYTDSPPNIADTTEFEAVLYADGTIRFDYRKCEVEEFWNDGGSGISNGDGIHYSDITDAYGPVYELPPGSATFPQSYLSTNNPPPGFPRGLHNAGQRRFDNVNFTWRSNPESDLTGYCVYRSNASYGYSATPYDTVWPPDTTYTDTVPMYGYNFYVVTAFDGDYESRYSDQICVCVDTLPPALPSNLAVSYDSINQVVSLIWNASTDPRLKLTRIYRSEISGSYSTPLDSVLVPDSTFVDSGITLGETYYYVVTAVDSSNNESNYSNEDTVGVPVRFMSYSSLASAYNNGFRMVRNSTTDELFLSYAMSDSAALCTSTDDDGTTWSRSAFVGPGCFPSMALDSDTNIHCVFHGMVDMHFLGRLGGDRMSWFDVQDMQNYGFSAGRALVEKTRRTNSEPSMTGDLLGNRTLYYTVGYAWFSNNTWQHTSLYETQDSILSVCFAIDPLDTAWVVFNTYNSQDSNRLKIGKFYTQATPDSLENISTLDTYSSKGMTAVAIRSSDRSIWLVYERNGTIKCKKRDSTGTWQTYTVQSEGLYPTLSIGTAGSFIHFIWEKYYSETDIREIQTCYTNGRLWARPQKIAQVKSENCYPFIEKGAIAVWHDLDYPYWDVFKSQRTESGTWTTPENITNSVDDSRHPQVILYQTGSQTKFTYVWTEGHESPYELKVQVDSSSSDFVPLYAFDLGQEEACLFSEKRDGYVKYGNDCEETADYDRDCLHYRITGLDPGKTYKLRLVSLQAETDALWRQAVEIDGGSAVEVDLGRNNILTKDIMLPQECYRDGAVDVKIRKVVGPKAVLSAMSVWEYEKDYLTTRSGGPQSSNNEPLSSVLFGGIYPNPGREDTKIKLDAPYKCNVSIRLYDVTGRMVDEIFSGPITGFHEIPVVSRETASGVYFVRVIAEGETITEKVILLR